MSRYGAASDPPVGTLVQPVASTSAAIEPRPSLASPWTESGSFYAFGSGSPRSLHTRRAPPYKGRSHKASPSPSPSHLSRPASPAVLMTTAVCCCCGTELRYPRASPSFRCPTCDQIVDLSAEARRGKAPDGVAVPEATPVSAARWLAVLESLDPDPSSASLADQLEQVTLSTSASSPSEPEQNLLDVLGETFASLPSLEASLKPPTDGRPGSKRTPPRHLLQRMKSAIRNRPMAAERLRERVAAMLQRPGPTMLDSDGTWLIALFESPVFFADVTPDPDTRQLLLARFVGLVSNLPNNLHHALVTYLASPAYPRADLLEKVELVCSFLAQRIADAIQADQPGSYALDWQVRAAARVASLLFAANEKHRRLPLTAFYVTLIDSLGPAALFVDFETWETTRESFSLCQYPFLLSLGAKILLLTYDGEREMVERTNEAYRANLSAEEAESPLLVLNVRREQLVGDSLQQISLNHRSLTKPLRIKWQDEEGIDAGGLRKEWFLLLCRQLFDPQYGMFLVDEESQFAWFNPAAVGMEDDFWLVGVVVGLALYNGANIDIPLPPVTYKLLSASSSSALTLPDLASLNPALARGLEQLLAHPADQVADTFCRTFVGSYEAWGEVVELELVKDGGEIVVDGENRQDYVDRLVDFTLIGSVEDQFTSFAKGFSEVCAGNALSLFKAEELELVIRGSPEQLDVGALRTVTTYEGFSQTEPSVDFFWSVFAAFSPEDQRRLLAFITASDRLPATGITSLELKLQCLGDDCDRFPQSHTCFNTLSLYRYSTREKMEVMLRRAIDDSEGFGLR